MIWIEISRGLRCSEMQGFRISFWSLLDPFAGIGFSLQFPVNCGMGCFYQKCCPVSKQSQYDFIVEYFDAVFPGTSM